MSSLAIAMNKGALEGGLFLVSCGIFKLWMSKRTNNNTKSFSKIDTDLKNERCPDPEDASRSYNIYPEEKIVVRFLH
ncbi:hypothetical protein TTHERM_00106980 (macronuclear) [Tetrahymena thermophila SB210]|uniref:Uncharacterized protein n=1 Tax=Tetrahymena thermophila (strain SB210) TaxID=312017 RepID=Q234A6_TETTS|nr:hypothetical protein TTHERM_00106980 [Tetrahymena thermophila SB210]EAR92096.1 hypothetical protein TTHERM_00106980 [Tetrahymena thermophila SB210]|eukprot:XP_001012342.1 hypothetical protein TTHERM_00106980 [Tetrahymena thermophila SB210]